MLKLSTNEVGNYPVGWHEVTIAKATDGDFDGTRYIDLHFKDLPENLKCRVWSAVNATTGEDFGIGNLFHFANAGIKTDDDGILTIDDNAHHLHGKTLNVLFYENDNGFTDAAQRVVPVVRDGFSEGYVEKLKTKAETWVRSRTNGTTHTTTNVVNGTHTKTTSTTGEEVPF